MGYQQALALAWDDIADLTEVPRHTVRMLADSYSVDIPARTVISDSCGIPAKEAVAIIALHYLAGSLRLKGMPALAGEWVDFRTFEGGEAYYPTFRKRTIDRIAKKFGKDPEAFRASCGRYPSQPAPVGDVSFAVDVFPEIPILVALYRGDEEFGPSANILFDRSTGAIFSTEDIVVMTEILIHSL